MYHILIFLSVKTIRILHCFASLKNKTLNFIINPHFLFANLILLSTAGENCLEEKNVCWAYIFSSRR